MHASSLSGALADLEAVEALPSMPLPLAAHFGFGHGSVMPWIPSQTVRDLRARAVSAQDRLRAAYGRRLSARAAAGLVDRHIIGHAEALRLSFWKQNG